MSEEEKEKEITQEVKDSIIKDYLASQTHIDEMNAEKGKWGDSYKTNKLPSLLDEARKNERAKVTLELQPEETEMEKRLKALEQSNAEKDKVIELSKMKQALSVKAKEIGFDTDRAGRYSVYGDNAEKYMLEDYEFMKETITSEIDKNIKDSFSTETPPSTTKDDSGYDFKAVMKDSVGKIQK